MSRDLLFFEAGSDWKMVRSGQSMTCVNSMINVTSGLARLIKVRHTGWGPRDAYRQ